VDVSLGAAEASGFTGTVGPNVIVGLTGNQAQGTVGTLFPIYWVNVDDTQVANWQNINNPQTPGWAVIGNEQTADWEEIAT
jgi:hypothetical protein